MIRSFSPFLTSLLSRKHSLALLHPSNTFLPWLTTMGMSLCHSSMAHDAYMVATSLVMLSIGPVETFQLRLRGYLQINNTTWFPGYVYDYIMLEHGDALAQRLKELPYGRPSDIK
ncbi:hypothetical protein DFS33DRAFT_389201 [Desarmillaria ectypa]|nr:hypothetical protein DFS33DRAFT_389201 [Desarmillaria ectypa]